MLIEECDKLEYENFLNNLFEYSSFFDPDLYDVLNLNVRYFLIKKGESVKAGFLLPVNENNKYKIDGHDFLIYTGLILSNDFSSMSISKFNNDTFKIYTLFSEYLADNFKEININLDFNIKDARPFMWHNYHTPEEGRFSVDMRYTAILELQNRSLDDVFSQFEYTKKNIIRQAEKKNCTEFKLLEESDYEGFTDTYISMMKRQSDQLDSSIKEMKARSDVLELLKFEKSIAFCVYEDGEPGFYGLWLQGKKTSCYLIGCNTGRKIKYAGVCFIWESIKYFKEAGLNYLDLEGANSPIRGWNKLSFGSQLTQYLNLEKK